MESPIALPLPRRIPSIWWRLILLALLGGYLYGWVSLWKGLPPSGILKNAVTAWSAIRQPKVQDNILPSRFQGTGVLHADKARMAPGMTFVTEFRHGQFRGLLLDADGQVRHEWQLPFSQAWPKAPQLQYQVADDKMSWHGAHLFPNGDVVFNFEGDGFPYGSGTVRLDKNSHVLWKLPLNTNHTVEVGENGHLWIANQKWVEQGQSKHPLLTAAHYEDFALELSPGGKVLREIDLLDSLYHSDYRGLLPVVQGAPPDWRQSLLIVSGDPVHVNSIEPLSHAIASAFPLFRPGDILVSLRNLSAICVLDADSLQVKWALSGPFVQQHSAHFTPDGRIILLDNAGASPDLRASRVIMIDPVTQKIVWSFDHDFDTAIRGTVRVLPNGNVLIAEAQSGRVLEVTPAHEVVWEYVNGLDRLTEDGHKAVGLVTYAQRVPPADLGFLDPPS